jgi:hypothetical protein
MVKLQWSSSRIARGPIAPAYLRAERVPSP